MPQRRVLVLTTFGIDECIVDARRVVAEPTVKTHVPNLLGKLVLRDRVQAVTYAYESGLVPRGA